MFDFASDTMFVQIFLSVACVEHLAQLMAELRVAILTGVVVGPLRIRFSFHRIFRSQNCKQEAFLGRKASLIPSVERTYRTAKLVAGAMIQNLFVISGSFWRLESCWSHNNINHHPSIKFFRTSIVSSITKASLAQRVHTVAFIRYCRGMRKTVVTT